MAAGNWPGSPAAPSDNCDAAKAGARGRSALDGSYRNPGDNAGRHLTAGNANNSVQGPIVSQTGWQ
jgi:hypothetical protein